MKAELTTSWILKSEKGYTLTSVLVVSALATIVFVLASEIISNSVYHLNRMKTLTAVSNIRSNLVGVMQNESAWFQTINDAANAVEATGYVECLQENPNALDCNGKGGALRIISAGGTPYLDPVTSATAGFTFEGKTCNEFDAVAGSVTCPLRVEINWATICDPGVVCLTPGIVIAVTFQLKRASGARSVAFNPENYNFSVFR